MSHNEKEENVDIEDNIEDNDLSQSLIYLCLLCYNTKLCRVCIVSARSNVSDDVHLTWRLQPDMDHSSHLIIITNQLVVINNANTDAIIITAELVITIITISLSPMQCVSMQAWKATSVSPEQDPTLPEAPSIRRRRVLNKIFYNPSISAWSNSDATE